MSHPLTNLSDRALKILVIMLLAGQPVSADYLRAHYHQRLSANSLKDALFELTESRLAVRTAYRGHAYLATPHARQLLLGETSPAEVSRPQIEPSYPQAGYTLTGETSPTEVSNLSQRGFGSLARSSSREGQTEKTEPLLLDSGETSPTEVSRPQAVDRQTAALAALDEAGISEPARSKLAAMPHVTADYIAAHVWRARQDNERNGRDGDGLALAVYRMTEKHRQPRMPLSPEAEREKYLDWLT